MSYLDDVLKQVGIKSLQDLQLPETKFDSKVDFDGDGVVIEGHIVSVNERNNEFSLAGDDEDIWVIKVNDVLESAKASKSLDGVPGESIKLKIKAGATIKLERNMEVGKHIIGSATMEPLDVEEKELQSGPPKGCKCARRCKRGWCCAQGGWVYKCQRSSCVFTRVRC